MDQLINNICLVEFARLDEISDFKQSPTGAAEVVASWQILDCASGARLNISQSHTKAGRLFEISFSCTMRSKLLNKNLLIVRITLSGGEQLLVGDRDLPVRFLEDHSLQSKSLSFSHASWHYPYRLFAVEV